jgi:uncharacterized protein YjbJ (UPF0337 family)
VLTRDQAQVRFDEPFPHALTWSKRRFRDSRPTTALSRHGRPSMDNNRIDGAAHEAKGSIKEQIGSATDNRSQQVEGNLEKHAGRAEQMIDAMAKRMRGDDAKR